MWPFLIVLEHSVSSTFFGIVIASYSVANIILSPLFGWWSNKIGTIKTPVNFGLFAQLLGNVVYMNLELFPFGAKYGMVVARLLIGVGSITITLFKTYSASGSNAKDRSIAIAYITCGKDSENYQSIPKYDRIAIFVIYVTRFCQFFVYTNLEALSSPISLMLFGWTKKYSISVLSTAQGFLGLCAFLVYFFYIIFKLNRFIRYRLNCISGFFILMAFYFITFPYPFLPNVVTYHSLNVTENGTEIVGCDIDMYPWCENITHVNPWIYLISFSMLFGIGFPVISIAMYTLFSKILGPRRQGTQQRFLQMLGGCGQLIGPLITSSICTNYGPRYVWEAEVIFITLTLSLWVIFFRRMVPMKYQINKVSDKDNKNHKSN
uniref:MFS domain-containing protein n=1 Tax=Strongyloides papillosus TaxID=174720 RepID=A0A0N5BDD1_STREA